MNKEEFNKLLKKKKPEEIIKLYIHNKISLRDYQLNKVVKLKNEKR